MGVLHDRLTGLDATVTTPDDIATARLQGESSVTISLVPGYFATTTTARLAGKVAALGELLWAAREDVIRRTLGESGHSYDEAPALSTRDAAFRRARDELVCEGRSADESVTAAAAGMTAWTAYVSASALRSEEDFVRSAGEAISAVFADRLPQLHRLAARAT